MTETTADDTFMTRKETAELTKLGQSTLERWSREKRGPKPIRLSARRVVYRRSEVLSWIKKCEGAGDVANC